MSTALLVVLCCSPAIWLFGGRLTQIHMLYSGETRQTAAYAAVIWPIFWPTWGVVCLVARIVRVLRRRAHD